MPLRPVGVGTGATACIGAATSRALAADGWHVVAGARRIDRIDALATEIDGTSIALDVTDQASVDRFVAGVVEVAGDDRCRLLVNNAGGALGVESLAEAVDQKWSTMFETNVLGCVRMPRGLLPHMIAAGDGHVVNVTSLAARQGHPD